MTSFNLSIKKNQAENVGITVKNGEIIFVLGANGTGKSSLMYNFKIQFPNSLRILAHRKSWLNNSLSELTASGLVSYEQSTRSNDSRKESRYKDLNSDIAGQMLIYRIINSENIRAREIAEAGGKNDWGLAKRLSEKKGIVSSINDLLASCNLPIEISIGPNDGLLASKNGSATFSIEMLSDGERNAFIICATVLLASPDTLILLDEPEKHMHRSIISPLLSNLVLTRNDCAFIVSTHDIQFAADHQGFPVVLTRGFTINGASEYWDFDILTDTTEIPDNLKVDILGSKRKILFVEGESQSLDKSLYQLIFPEVTVIARGSCSQVERAVEGINASDGLHHVKAYGLIDADDRTPEQISELQIKNIIALPLYSVEAIYYHPRMIKYVAEKFGSIQQEDPEPLIYQAYLNAREAIRPHKKRLCSRLCEKNVRQKMFSQLPTHTDILNGAVINVQLDVASLLATEEQKFDSLIDKIDISELIVRYPIRETPAITKILEALGLRRTQYENIVRKLVSEDPNVLIFLRTNLLASLTSLIDR